jgi:hypothetical protein
LGTFRTCGRKEGTANEQGPRQMERKNAHSTHKIDEFFVGFALFWLCGELYFQSVCKRKIETT